MKVKTNEEQLSSYAEGQLHRMLVRMTGAKTVLIIGRLKVPSILAMAELVPEDSSITICATQPHFGESSQEAFDFSAHGNKMRAQIGPIMDSLEELAAVGKDFDIVFIDADQRNPAEYYRFVMENHLLRMDGTLCIENALMKGEAYLENTADENVLGVKKLNQVINSDPHTEQVVLPVEGGLILLQRSRICADEETNLGGVVKDDVFWGHRGCRILDRLQLDGKVAYVTGGGQGIGRAFCHALGEAGAKVAVADLVLAKAEAVACELRLKGIKSIAIAADVSRPEDVQRMLATIVDKWGTVHIACNNAGINMNSPSEATSLEEWDKTFNVNLRGLFLCCQAAGRIMLNQGYGKIINTASMASLIVPHPQKQLAYNASKAGVVKLTQTLGTEWIDRGVRVNCISPGIVETPLIHSEELKPLVQCWLTDIPAGRLARVTDLQAAVIYLASEASDYMTGHNLVIEGGQSLW
ncbi:D-threitol dehydrogenase-like [Podarcis raffonei]|uniref:D-threitol dehydrogenase-like n=1 Tax=Podarcis raffonei TaxID=65483 RepID=UPI0023293985|nr:D-threitol dehydrogenase-like [Podarcis raffonei]